MAANMYRVGDYVYFENSSSNPFLIRRIEELNKTANGNVEAKVVCFYRRRDIPSTLIGLADKHASKFWGRESLLINNSNTSHLHTVEEEGLESSLGGGNQPESAEWRQQQFLPSLRSDTCTPICNKNPSS
ncbi:metastasis-associated protein MTA3-like [Callorhinchus milii]|uniref:metastasis-associated protein MTA3-like n=1 Tax=Callorhinchus milii TaxID=7868 RepID=UPI001C3FE807|nr:metastasis-associated protein MTA3-like [Callorhinchus milii]